jgi:DNA-binding NarL/FixJ family response regulator
MWLKLAPGMAIVGEAGDGLAALSRAAVVRPDVILLDIESAGMDGVELIRALRKASPESAVVVLSLSDDTLTRRRAAAAGAAAFVSKHDCGDRLLQAARQAAVKEDEPNHMGKALV